MTLRKKPFENTMRKGENTGNQHVLLFPPIFSTNPKRRISVFNLHLFRRLQMLWICTSLKISCLVKGYLVTKQRNITPDKTESTCRRQNKRDWKIKICVEMGRKHCGEKEKMLVTSVFSFSHNVFKRLIYQGLWNLGLHGKGLTKFY